MDTVLIENLKALALAATAGPWVANCTIIGRPNEAAVKEPGSFDWICSMQVSNQLNWDRDAAYIAAANPATVLALIAENERLRAQLHGKDS